MTRCPRCGTPADAVPVTHHVAPGSARLLRERLDVVRRELGLRSEGDALAAAVRIAALDLNQGTRIGSSESGHTVRAIRPRRKDVSEHEQEEPGTPDEQVDDGGATAGSTGEQGAQPSEPGPTDPETEGGEPVEEGDGGAGTVVNTDGGDAVVDGGDGGDGGAAPEGEEPAPE